MEERFYKAGKSLFAASHWVGCKTGITHPLPPECKMIWVVCKDRYNFFVTLSKGEWYDNQDSIAEATNTSRATVNRFLKLLEKEGVIEVRKVQKKGGWKSNSYKILRDIEFATDNKKAPSTAMEEALRDTTNSEASVTEDNAFVKNENMGQQGAISVQMNEGKPTPLPNEQSRERASAAPMMDSIEWLSGEIWRIKDREQNSHQDRALLKQYEQRLEKLQFEAETLPW